VATRQISSNGKSKSPRVQVVLPELLCERLSALAQEESRTVSNMAKVLIQEGITKYEQEKSPAKNSSQDLKTTAEFRVALESQQPRRLRGAPRRFRIHKP